jgi:pimeloyl-ACP methyl ester carboxylesterase
MTSTDPLPHAPDRAPRWVQAGIRVGDCDTDYRCAGSGRPLVALSRRLDPPFLRQCDLLAREARVVAPVMPDGTPAECTAWLVDLLDGFGFEAATIVADDTAALAAVALALEWPERVTAVRLLFPPAMAECIVIAESAMDGA